MPLVYDELRKLAAARMAHESLDHTLQATALVHEAYVRLVDGGQARGWDSRGHFFAAAAEAMRRILVDAARRKKAEKRGGEWQRVSLDEAAPWMQTDPDELLVLDYALRQLADQDPLGAKLVELKYFAGLSTEDAAAATGVSPATAYRHSAFARAWLHAEIARSGRSSEF